MPLTTLISAEVLTGSGSSLTRTTVAVTPDGRRTRLVVQLPPARALPQRPTSAPRARSSKPRPSASRSSAASGDSPDSDPASPDRLAAGDAIAAFERLTSLRGVRGVVLSGPARRPRIVVRHDGGGDIVLTGYGTLLNRRSALKCFLAQGHSIERCSTTEWEQAAAALRVSATLADLTRAS